MDKLTLLLTIALFGFGLFSIVTASTREAVNNLNQSVYYYFIKQIIILSICFAVYLFVLMIPTDKYNKYLVFIGWLIVLVLNIWVALRGSVTRGASNWIKIPIIGFQLQPSELAKPILIVSMALFIESTAKFFRNKNENHIPGIVLMLGFGLITSVFIVLQKDLGTMIINVGIFGVMFLASPIVPKEKFLTIVTCLGILLVGFAGTKVLIL